MLRRADVCIAGNIEQLPEKMRHSLLAMHAHGLHGQAQDSKIRLTDFQPPDFCQAGAPFFTVADSNVPILMSLMLLTCSGAVYRCIACIGIHGSALDLSGQNMTA